MPLEPLIHYSNVHFIIFTFDCHVSGYIKSFIFPQGKLDDTGKIGIDFRLYIYSYKNHYCSIIRTITQKFYIENK